MFSGMNYVYEVYKERSFSKAAENLYISQPALSAMIKKVENKVGMPLFDRSTNPIQLTDCGKRYIKTAEKIMDLDERFKNSDQLRTYEFRIKGDSHAAGKTIGELEMNLAAMDAPLPDVYAQKLQALRPLA